MPTQLRPKSRPIRMPKLNRRFLANLSTLTGLPVRFLALPPKHPKRVHAHVRTLRVT